MYYRNPFNCPRRAATVKNILVIGVVVLSLVACDKRQGSAPEPIEAVPVMTISPPSCEDQDVREKAALKNLAPEYRNVGFPISVQELAEHRRKVDGLEMWAREIDDYCVRTAYLGWIDSFNHSLDRAAESFDENTRAEALAETLPKPPR